MSEDQDSEKHSGSFSHWLARWLVVFRYKVRSGYKKVVEQLYGNSCKIYISGTGVKEVSAKIKVKNHGLTEEVVQ